MDMARQTRTMQALALPPEPRSVPMICRWISYSLAAALIAVPASSQAVPPALLYMLKQMAQQAATSMIKDALLSNLSGMGCKGIALSNALSAFDLRRAGGGSLAGGLTGGLMGGLPPGASIPPDIAAKMGALMPGAGQLPAGIDPEMMARAQQMLSQPPLSPPETIAAIDEMFELGFMPKAIQTEFKQCMVLVPATVPTLGMAMGLFKPMIPQMRQAREQLHALSPAEQDEVAAELAQQLKALPADQRAALVEHFDSGFFPPRVSAAAKAGLAATPSR
jgi:hypothetical protein